jgi:ribosomal protein S2
MLLRIEEKRKTNYFKKRILKMPRTNFQDLLDAGVHIIDLHKTVIKIDEAANVMKQLARAGRKILFVATKKQAKDIVSEKALAVNMPYVTERWPGGMLTNFPTIRKAVKKMNTIDKMMTDGTFETLAKREKLQVTRQRALVLLQILTDCHLPYLSLTSKKR